MTPGWGRVKVGPIGDGPTLSELLPLHEFYFEQTERDPYLAGIQGANLVREIFLQLNRKADRPLPVGTCPRGDADDQFVGLVGHDTNLAHLNRLLNVEWNFKDSQLPADTRHLPDNDALPAGALVFELRGEKPNYRVRIQYVSQTLGEIRNALRPGDPYLSRPPVTERAHAKCRSMILAHLPKALSNNSTPFSRTVTKTVRRLARPNQPGVPHLPRTESKDDGEVGVCHPHTTW